MSNPLGLSHEDAKAAFPEMFRDEVESAYTADIACCDSCYDEFVALWPHVPAANNHSFERMQISIELFYENSRLSECFSKEEFSEFAPELECPRCGGQLGSNMWPYNFPFD